MASINGSVGAGGINRSSDVQMVQERLNRHVARVGLPRLRVDGAIGPKTVEAIRRFQAMIMGLKMPDGRVDAQGKTIAALEGHPSEPAKQTKPVPAHVTAFIAKLLPAARKVKESWGVPVAVTIAQAALETGWGKSVKSNAYFGIKGKSPSGKSTTFTTHEVIGGKAIRLDDKFRAYESLDEAADDYGRFLNENPRYAKCFSHKDDPEQFVKELAAAGYATDPDYAAKIISMIRRYGLADHDQQTK